jgi:hypothetical protein
MGEREGGADLAVAFVSFLRLIGRSLVHKSEGSFATLWVAPVEEYDDFFDAFAELSLGDDDPRPVASRGSGSCSVTPPGSLASVGAVTPPAHVSSGELLPPLPDLIARTALWDALRLPRSISLLYRLRRVNRRWRDFIGTTLEWTALEFTKLDNPGYQRFAWRWRGRHRYRTRYERYNIEIGNLRVVLDEPRLPIGNLEWCVEARPGLATEVVSDDLDYYALVAMDSM